MIANKCPPAVCQYNTECPRPTPIPENRQNEQASALQTWGTWFELSEPLIESCRKSFAPVDSSLLLHESGPSGQVLRLAEPKGGSIPSGWNGSLRFEKLLGEMGNWKASIQLVHGNRRFTKFKDNDGSDDIKLNWSLIDNADVEEEFRAFIDNTPDGEFIDAELTVGNDDASEVDGFKQTMSFPLRLSQIDRLVLPLSPLYVIFEDPQYNRRLASKTHSNTKVIKFNGFEDPQTVTLAGDRREYNPNSKLFAAFYRSNFTDSGPPPPPGGTLKAKWKLSRIDQDGVVHVLRKFPTSNNVGDFVHERTLIEIELGLYDAHFSRRCAGVGVCSSTLQLKKLATPPLLRDSTSLENL